jgi:NTP pyrophosphatase (non-canonical NTP hydrolase)
MKMNEIPSATLSLKSLRDAGRPRAQRWHEANPWTVTDWSNAMAGEAGECCNKVKKLRRVQDGIANLNKADRQLSSEKEAIAAIAEECADTLIYLDRLADFLGIDLAVATVEKFNKTSEEYGFPERLALSSIVTETVALPQTLSYAEVIPGKVVGDCVLAGIAYSPSGTPHAFGLVGIVGSGLGDKMNWQDAMAWASGLNATLPSRAELSVLYNTLRDKFQAEPYWSEEPHAGDPGYAWSQGFNDGRQWGYHESSELLAVAVRRFPIQ